MKDLIISNKINNLYTEAKNIGIKLPIVGSVVETIERSNIVAGYCDVQNNIIVINVLKEYLNEETVFHELLHAKHTNQGFINGSVGVNAGSQEEKVGGAALSLLAHKKVLDEMRFNQIELKKDWSSPILNALYLIDDNSINLFFLDCALFLAYVNEYNLDEYQFSKQVYEKKYPKLFNMVDNVVKFVSVLDVSDHFAFRRSAIRLFKYLNEEVIPEVDFRKSICIGFIPSNRQLDLSISQVFDIKRNYKKSGRTAFITKAEGQVSLLIKDPLRTLPDVTIRQLMREIDYPYVTKDLQLIR